MGLSGGGAEWRERAEADLLWYRQARDEAMDAQALLSTLRAPTCARWSFVGAAQSTPGNPTLVRAVAALPLAERAAAASCVVRAIDGWLWAPERRADDRLLVALLYGLHRPERRTLPEAAEALGIPCASDDEARWLAEHLDSLLAEIAAALRATRREGSRDGRTDAR